MVALTRRRKATEDLLRHQDHYGEISAILEDDFIDSVDATFDLIQSHPHAGRPAVFYTDIPRMRYYPLVPISREFPYLAFYLDLADSCELVRVLHVRSDIQAELSGEG